MPFTIENSDGVMRLVLTGGVTIRHARTLVQSISSALPPNASVVVQTKDLDDIDTSALQVLLSLQKTASTFAIEDCSQAFLDAVDRCALRRDLLAGWKED